MANKHDEWLLRPTFASAYIRRCRTFWKKAFENSALLGELMVRREFL
jgi:hypothetical protein